MVAIALALVGTPLAVRALLPVRGARLAAAALVGCAVALVVLLGGAAGYET